MNSPFKADAQTLLDLNIFDERQGPTVFSMFSNTQTVGGKVKVRLMMENPSADLEFLLKRQEVLKLLDSQNTKLNLINHEMEFIEHYLTFNYKVLKTGLLNVLSVRMQHLSNNDGNLYIITHGIYLTAQFIKALSDITNLYQPDRNKWLSSCIEDISILKSDGDVAAYIANPSKTIPVRLLAKLDTFFRKTYSENLKRLLNYAYELDAYGAILSAKNKHSLCIPNFKNTLDIHLEAMGVFHPHVPNPVRNIVNVSSGKNIIFLTGANMSGKSVYLKAVGISVYLAHIGFPVFAESMTCTVWNGLVSCINLSDNIDSGYSHYYSEIMRLKYAVTSVRRDRRMFILFDELFKGTNADDAMDASILLIKELNNIRDSAFYLSSHLMDLSNKLQTLSNLSFQCFKAKVENNELEFDYKLHEGVSRDRVGLQIFLNAQILEIIKGVK